MERTLRRRPAAPIRRIGPRPVASAAAAEASLSETEAAPTISVMWGAFTDAIAVVGMTIADVRGLLHRAHGIPAFAFTRVNGAEVEPTYRLAAGDTLEFVREGGEKGARG
jgi:hypothetical protein